MKKCIKTHGKSLQKRIDLKTEDADRGSNRYNISSSW